MGQTESAQASGGIHHCSVKWSWIVPLLSVGACPQQNSPCKVLGFAKRRRFPVRFPRFTVIFTDFQRNNTQEGDHRELALRDKTIRVTLNL